MSAFQPSVSSYNVLEDTCGGYVRRIAESDQAAFAAFYDATNRLIYGMAVRFLGNFADAEEVTLDIYIQVWHNAAAFDGQRGSAIAWLTNMARSRLIDRIRAGASRQLHEVAIAGHPLAAPEEHMSQPDVGRRIQTALKTLTFEQREAIELSYWYGYSHTELAARLAQPLGTVKTRIRMGMMKLRSELGNLA